MVKVLNEDMIVAMVIAIYVFNQIFLDKKETLEVDMRRG